MRRGRGFTMIELLVTLAIMGLLISLAVPRYFGNIAKAREDVLREDLYLMRDAIDKFYADRNKYPEDLNELVTGLYLRKIPVDPLTQSSHSWVPVAPTDGSAGKVADVRSGTPGKALDGTLFKDW